MTQIDNPDELLEAYQEAVRKYELVQGLMMEALADKKAAKAAVALAAWYRGRREEAFDAWRATWADASHAPAALESA